MTERFQNPSDDEIQALLERIKTLAVVGLSGSSLRASHGVAKAMQGFGYRIIPVNPGIERVLGETSYPTLEAVPETIDLVDVFRASQHVAGIVDDCIRLELPALWLQESVIDEQAALRAQAAGVQVVMDRCIYREYARLIR